MKNKKIIIGSSLIVFVGLFFLGAKFYGSYEEERLDFLAKEKSQLFVRDYSPRLGSDDAKVYLTEFLDPACESCRKFYPQVKSLLEKYEGKLKLVVRYAPFHSNSRFAVKVLEASRKQGKYWDALGILFHYQPYWSHGAEREAMFEYLAKAGIDIKKLKSDMNDFQIKEIIRQDIEDGKKIGVRATPTFFVNGKPLERFGIGYLREAIQNEIDRVY